MEIACARLFKLVFAFFAFVFATAPFTWFYVHKCKSVLRKKYPEKWQWVTMFPGIGPGWNNHFRMMVFVFSKDDTGDPEIIRYKKILKRFFTLILLVFGVVVISFIVLFISMLFSA